MPKWTDAQQRVIDTRKKNMLVSAAAGSGKTAVLVERIIQKISDKTQPVDIDQIVVVTFTRAAAAEMRERILKGVMDALEADPDNEHLMKQATLVHNAFITTIDSFCNYVVRNYFYEIDLDPAFRIGNPAEIKLMKSYVMDTMLESEYEKAMGEEESSFLAFVDAYAKGNSDAAVSEMILSLYEKAQSYPWPAEWLTNLTKPYEIKEVEELNQVEWFKWITSLLRDEVVEALEDTKELLSLALSPEGPECYSKGLQKDVEMYEDILVFDDSLRFYNALRESKYGSVGRKPSKYAGDEELLQRVKDKRDDIKKRIEKSKETYLAFSVEEILFQMKSQYPVVQELTRLALDFSEAMMSYKKKKNIFDFSDIEHFALEILKDKESKELRSPALTFVNQFEEIMIDEYQDSNYIQEEILTSISKESVGSHNMFMVGDVKQSIYSFRQACPEIFMGKYERFKVDEEDNLAIDLHKNFRSRAEVLDFTNDVFYALMHKDLGNVEYDKDAALYLGSDAYEDVPDMFSGEILVADYNSDLLEDYDKVRFEAKVVADKIKGMLKSQLVTDKPTGKLRPMRFSDVVILMRSLTNIDAFLEVLQENGVPAFAESRSGYFNTIEVETVLHLLRVIDNPYQDIPLTAVLHSPMFGFTNDELALIHKPGEKLMDALLSYRGEHPEIGKIERFLNYLQEKRQQVTDVPIHRLLELLLEETNYLSYVTALPRGERRRANLQKLMDEAVAYEQSSYKGLFNFLHYMEQMQKYSIEMGEASLNSEYDNVVTIMSIHKSKGLEFPVVVLAGMGKQHNEMDLSGKMVLHPDLGVGIELISQKEQTKISPLYKKVVEKGIRWNLYGEELRILYVAMTRAKEKLVLLGCLRNATSSIDTWEETKTPMSLGARSRSKSYLEWVIRSTATKREQYPIEVIAPETIVAGEVLEETSNAQRRLDLEAAIRDVSVNPYAFLEVEPKEFKYKNKYSVSEIKHRRMEEAFVEESVERPAFLKEDVEKIVPSFISGKEKEGANAGALRGTAMHRFWECYDFAKEERGVIPEEMSSLLSEEKIQAFAETPLYQRMVVAARAGELYREKPFVMSVDPRSLFETAEPGEEPILIQGIIDAFFVEEEGIVVLDYKTDRVQNSNELIKRYDSQLQLYADTLKRTLSLPIKEILIYSFCLDETISIKPLQCY